MKKITFGAVLFAGLATLLPMRLVESSQVSNPSRLGLKGEMVFLVTEVDEFDENSEIKVGDVITSVLPEGKTDQGEDGGPCGQLSSLEALRNELKMSAAVSPSESGC